MGTVHCAKHLRFCVKIRHVGKSACAAVRAGFGSVHTHCLKATAASLPFLLAASCAVTASWVLTEKSTQLPIFIHFRIEAPVCDHERLAACNISTKITFLIAKCHFGGFKFSQKENGRMAEFTA